MRRRRSWKGKSVAPKILRASAGFHDLHCKPRIDDATPAINTDGSSSNANAYDIERVPGHSRVCTSDSPKPIKFFMFKTLMCSPGYSTVYEMCIIHNSDPGYVSHLTCRCFPTVM
ncbi:hypothetical protein NEOLEDRAFT_1141816 [Neolentinus lepideus HHB14362 ss-1]|uniref:Uncharacterized protein n=1 Tax=Neolentinus lepideus HHB14362 ss-1 TaxID=1314782 RepID=A0A165NHZ1_9AGAM|nr:hypothetical protein NEOLEDRAFT_1141816 [Neolentinus lepideus HHB14362 ss-1]